MKNFDGKKYRDKEKLVHSLQQQVKLIFNLITICKYVSLKMVLVNNKYYVQYLNVK